MPRGLLYDNLKAPLAALANDFGRSPLTPPGEARPRLRPRPRARPKVGASTFTVTSTASLTEA
ncbi:MAG TPA: hypothetical protein VHP33_26305, partial [Polyangiaceae bacterium]|nr:hypothetical protein [Polyangiaceae bacterium]